MWGWKKEKSSISYLNISYLMQKREGFDYLA